MQACEQFILRSKNLGLVERYMQLIENTIQDLFKTGRTKHAEETVGFRLFGKPGDNEYHAKLLNAIANARTECGLFCPTNNTPSELDTLRNCISTRIWLLENYLKKRSSAEELGSRLYNKRLNVREFYQHHRDQMLAFALEPINLEEIKQNYDEHFHAPDNDPIRPFSCINIAVAENCPRG